jgi:D-ribose pyranase
MKKIGILNAEISSVISKMGHTDLIAIGDCGLPIPDCIKRIDLALKKNVPSFSDTLSEVLENLEVEEIFVAQEAIGSSPKICEKVKELAGTAKITFISHEKLKEMLKNCKSVIRTGEQTSFANVILKSGVIF